MKVFIIIFSSIALVYSLLINGVSQPVSEKEIEGCYFQKIKTPFNKICLKTDGRMEQFTISDHGTDFELYNKGTWRSYSVAEYGNEVAAAVLNNYLDPLSDQTEVDIIPYKGLFGQISFVVSGRSNGDDKIYILEEEISFFRSI